MFTDQCLLITDVVDQYVVVMSLGSDELESLLKEIAPQDRLAFALCCQQWRRVSRFYRAAIGACDKRSGVATAGVSGRCLRGSVYSADRWHRRRAEENRRL